MTKAGIEASKTVFPSPTQIGGLAEVWMDAEGKLNAPVQKDFGAGSLMEVQQHSGRQCSEPERH